MFSRLTRNAHLWLPGYLKWRRQQWGTARPARLWLLLADHFEPFWRGAEEATAARRVEMWRREWPEIAARHSDSAGRPPCYTFFYAEEHYRPRLLDPLAEMAEQGIADVEVHIHHDGEGEADFVDRMGRFTETLLDRHGLLRRHEGKIAFGFIHGNWALDNSHPQGRWCGLNNELTLLRQLGCYADFTLPSAPSPTQTRLVNTIYWATDDPTQPRSHDTGTPVQAGRPAGGDLLLIPGPLGLNGRPGGGRLRPRLETGELAAHHGPTPQRARLWLRLAPRIGGDVFLKLFTHGAQEGNARALLGGDLDHTLEFLRAACAEAGMSFYFVSAWEMRQAVANVCRAEDPLRAIPVSRARETTRLTGNR